MRWEDIRSLARRKGWKVKKEGVFTTFVKSWKGYGGVSIWVQAQMIVTGRRHPRRKRGLYTVMVHTPNIKVIREYPNEEAKRFVGGCITEYD